MEDSNQMGMSSFGKHIIPKWNDVLNFLEALHVGEECGEVHIIIKKGEYWNIQIDSPKKKKPIALTTHCRGIGLFDLNW